MRGIRQSVPDLIGATILLVVGAAFVSGALGYQVFNDEGRIGPGFMPFTTGLLIAVFGVAVGIGALLKSRGQASSPASLEESNARPGVETPEEGSGSKRTVALVFFMTFAAILLTSLLGFLASFGLLVFTLARFIEKGGWLASVGLGAGAVVVAWLVFVVFLQIPLPMGVFGP